MWNRTTGRYYARFAISNATRGFLYFECEHNKYKQLFPEDFIIIIALTSDSLFNPLDPIPTPVQQQFSENVMNKGIVIL